MTSNFAVAELPSAADQWRGLQAVAVSGQEAKVEWIGLNGPDSASENLVRSHDLPQPWFLLDDRADRKRLGVAGTPFLYVVGDRGVFLGHTGPSPAHVQQVAGLCDTTEAEDHP
jgi:hypothetical protein